MLTFSNHAGETPSKRSKIEKETNFNVLVNFAVLIGLCVGCAIGAGVYDGMSGRSADFYEVGAAYSSSAVVVGFITFGCVVISPLLLLKTVCDLLRSASSGASSWR